MAFLRVSGANLIDSATRERATLRGAGLGGWMAYANLYLEVPSNAKRDSEWRTLYQVSIEA